MIPAQCALLTPEQIETASPGWPNGSSGIRRQARTVYLYLSCNQEVRTAPILRRALADGKRSVAAPCGRGAAASAFLDVDTPPVPDAWRASEATGRRLSTIPTALVLPAGLWRRRQARGLAIRRRFLRPVFAAREPLHPTSRFAMIFNCSPSVPAQPHDCRADAVISEATEVSFYENRGGLRI